jgi:hypothetical protein
MINRDFTGEQLAVAEVARGVACACRAHTEDRLRESRYTTEEVVALLSEGVV